MIVIFFITFGIIATLLAIFGYEKKRADSKMGITTKTTAAEIIGMIIFGVFFLISSLIINTFISFLTFMEADYVRYTVLTGGTVILLLTVIIQAQKKKFNKWLFMMLCIFIGTCIAGNLFHLI